MSTCETPVHFAGWGSDVPSAVVGNEELEQRFEAAGRSVNDASLEEMEAMWERVKGGS